MAVRFLPSGDTGLTVQLDEAADAATTRRVLRFREAVAAAAPPGVIETVPSYRSLLVHYDPLVTAQDALIAALRPLAERQATAETPGARHWRLPVCFEDAAFAPDLASVADWAAVTPDAVVAMITSARQLVYMLGFAPGQPYLGDLPGPLALPRRAAPIPAIPAGSVVIATGKTVIYPVSNPTGWHIVGRTPIRLFDRRAAQPALLAPGDAVTLAPISRGRFDEIAAQTEADAFRPRPDPAP